MGVALPRLADAAVDLEDGLADLPAHPGRRMPWPPGRPSAPSAAVGTVDRPGGVVRDAASGLQADVLLGAEMLDGLERADRLAELAALSGIRDGHRQRTGHRPDHVRADHHRGRTTRHRSSPAASTAPPIGRGSPVSSATTRDRSADPATGGPTSTATGRPPSSPTAADAPKASKAIAVPAAPKAPAAPRAAPATSPRVPSRAIVARPPPSAVLRPSPSSPVRATRSSSTASSGPTSGMADAARPKASTHSTTSTTDAPPGPESARIATKPLSSNARQARSASTSPASPDRPAATRPAVSASRLSSSFSVAFHAIPATVDFGDTADEAAFRDELRRWIDDQLPFAPLPDGDDERMARLGEWQRRLFDGGWAAVSFPEAYGGRGLGPVYEAIVLDELGSAGLPSAWHYGYIARVILHVRHRSAAAAVPAAGLQRPRAVVPGVQRTGRRLRPGVAHHPGRAGRRRVRRQRPEGLDLRSPLGALVPAARPVGAGRTGSPGACRASSSR